MSLKYVHFVEKTLTVVAGAGSVFIGDVHGEINQLQITPSVAGTKYNVSIQNSRGYITRLAQQHIGTFDNVIGLAQRPHLTLVFDESTKVDEVFTIFMSVYEKN